MFEFRSFWPQPTEMIPMSPKIVSSTNPKNEQIGPVAAKRLIASANRKRVENQKIFFKKEDEEGEGMWASTFNRSVIDREKGFE